MALRRRLGFCFVALAALSTVACTSEPEAAPEPEAKVDAAAVEALQALAEKLQAQDWAGAAAFLSEEWLRDVSEGDPKTKGYWRVLVADTSATDTRWAWFPLGPETALGGPTPTKGGGVAVALENEDVAAFDDSRPRFVVLRKTQGKWLLVSAHGADWKPEPPDSSGDASGD